MTLCKRILGRSRNERLHKHKISQVEKVMPSFEYEPLVLFLEPNIGKK
jgi:hypothetical protein